MGKSKPAPKEKEMSIDKTECFEQRGLGVVCWRTWYGTYPDMVSPIPMGSIPAASMMIQGREEAKRQRDGSNYQEGKDPTTRGCDKGMGIHQSETEGQMTRW